MSDAEEHDWMAKRENYLRRLIRGEIEITDTTATEQQILREIAGGVIGASDWGAEPDPAVAARAYRMLRASDHPEAEAEAARSRAYLHEQRDAGNDLAGEILRLLADDSWWLDEDRNVAPWRPPEE